MIQKQELDVKTPLLEAITALQDASSDRNAVGSLNHGAIVTLERLIALFDDEVPDDDFLLPTEYACETAASLIVETNTRMCGNFPKGSPAADGAGGIHTEWWRGEREVTLAVPGRPGGRFYIYHEIGDEYGLESEVSPETLSHWLNRLQQT